jgi:ABC-2 type transport system ATP-binding protein
MSSGSVVVMDEHAPIDDVTVRVTNVGHQYRTTIALAEVNLIFRRQRIYAVIGHNGAGKSTLLRLIGGVDRPSRGTVTVLGRPARSRWVAGPRGLGSGQSRGGSGSAGERQRCGLIQALAADIVVADEPFAGLDQAGRTWAHEQLRAAAAAGGTVIVACASLAHAADLATDVIVLEQGRVVHQGPMAGLSQSCGCEVVVRADHLMQLAAVLLRAGFQLGSPSPTLMPDQPEADTLRVVGATGREVGAVAAQAGIVLDHLERRQYDLPRALSHLLGPPWPSLVDQKNAPR